MSNLRYTKEMLEEAVLNATSFADLCRHFGIKPATGAQSHLRRRVDYFEIDTSHFVGAGWAKGKTFKKRPLEEYLVANSSLKSAKLRQRLIDAGLKDEQCERCGLSEWMEAKIPLELDHSNSDHFDCRLSNLLVVCPNCHAQLTFERRTRPSSPMQRPMP